MNKGGYKYEQLQRVLGMEESRIENDKSREDRLLEAIERLEARVEEMSKKNKPSLWARLWKW